MKLEIKNPFLFFDKKERILALVISFKQLTS